MNTIPAPGVAHVPLVVVERGDTVESVHVGSVAVVDADGRLVASAGDPRTVAYTRSSLKPLQAVPFVHGGGLLRYGFSARELAVICASHSGEAKHQATVAAILERIGASPADLQCGSHAPLVYEACRLTPPPPPHPTLAHNCSGKHAGMLAHCSACGYAKGDYLDPGHPLQREIRRAVAKFAGVPEAALVMGIDGCSAPNYALPLRSLAGAFARLAAAGDDPDYGAAPRTLADAMTAHPAMVSGEGRGDLALMEAGRGDWVAKVGAEGVQAIGVRSRGWGIAVKVSDGAVRGLHPAVVATLDQLGLLDDVARAALARWARPPVRNYRGIVTGEVESVLVLDKQPPRMQAEAGGRRQ